MEKSEFADVMSAAVRLLLATDACIGSNDIAVLVFRLLIT